MRRLRIPRKVLHAGGNQPPGATGGADVVWSGVVQCGHASVLRVIPGLLAQTKLLDESSIPFEILLHQVVEQSPALAYKHEQSSSRVMIMLVQLQVAGEVVDSLGENRDLDFSCPGVLLVLAVCLDEPSSVFLGEHCAHAFLQTCHPDPRTASRLVIAASQRRA